MPTTTLDVTGLPADVIENLERLIQSLRAHQAEKKPADPAAPLPRWNGTVLGPMHRHDLYDDGN
jgi:hypothetical protein